MKKMAMQVLYLMLLGLWMSASPSAERALALAAPFTNDMILQRGTTVPVWGFDTPGSTVTVEFAGQKKAAVTNPTGDWKVLLDPLEASTTERALTVSNAAGESIVVSGVLVGEVWFSSGQSNMVWVAGKSMCSDLARELAQVKDEVPVREIAIDTVSALYPQKRATAEGGWKRSRKANEFSALSLSFAHELYRELTVPIGILLSAHSNTRVEAFTQRQAIEAHPLLKEDVALIHTGDVCTEEGKAAFEQYARDLLAWQQTAIPLSAKGAAIPPRPNLPGIAGMWRGPSQFFSGKIAPVVPYAIRGAIWCQGTSNSGDGRIYAARMEALLRGWREAWGMPEMPFYFTQMQTYGSPDPDVVGFADIRQAQHLFFVNNRKGVGMVVQADLNAARPQGIHYYNKLHPGMRLARWALAKQYGKEIAFTGPIYAGCEIRGDAAVVSFEKESLFGGLMVGSKGMEQDRQQPDGYVEPARPTPGARLNHFRLCGEDRHWHAAEAAIVGDTVEVRSKDVPKPIGVQYAYSAVPENANLYNQAGLPATPFAVVNGAFIFQEQSQPEAAPEGEEAAEPAVQPARPILHIAEYYRNGVILQRDRPIPVWGHANAGVTVTVTLGDVTRTATADELEEWSVAFPARPATTEPMVLSVEASNGRTARVSDILVGDVWYLTGSTELTSQWPWDRRDKNATPPAPLPLVREFLRKTKSSTFETPRKRYFETGGGKYRSSWQAADYSTEEGGVSCFAYQFARALNRPGIPQGFITMSSGSSGQMASPLSWTSYAGVKDVTDPAFNARLDELRLQYPDSEVAQKALARHLQEVRACTDRILAIANAGGDLSTAPLQFPSFPRPGQRADVPSDAIPTYAYNWCVSPLTPMAVAGVIWVPSQANIGHEPACYAAELEIYARSLPGTYGQEQVPFFYAQPAESLVKGITLPSIPEGKKVDFDQWPKDLTPIAVRMAALAQ